MLDRQVHIEMLCSGLRNDLQELLGIVRNPNERKFASPDIQQIRDLSSEIFYANLGEEFRENLKNRLDELLPTEGNQDV